MVPGTLTIGKAVLTVTASSQTKVYGTANPALTVAYSGFAGADNAASLTTAPTATTTAVITSPVATYKTTASGGVSANYTFAYVDGLLTVTPATLTVTALTTAKTYGAANPAITVAYSGFAGTDNAASLTTVPTATTTAVTTSAAGTYPTTASGGASGNYTFTYVDGILTINKATLTVTADPKSKVYGAALPALTFTYSGFVGADNASVLTSAPTAGTVATAASAGGTYPITITGGAAANYTIAPVAGVLTVTPAALTVTASSGTKVYGAANPTLTASYSGFIGADNAASLTTAPTVTSTATATSTVGTYPTTASGGVSANYTFAYVPGSLTVTPVALTIAPIATSKVYGTANPTLAVSYTGFVGTDNAASLTTQPTVATTAVTASPVGTYPITATGAASPNYTIGYTTGIVFTITPVVLTVTASSATKAYGAANPTFTVSYSGFATGETATNLTTQPTATTTATVASLPGNYAVTAAGGVSTNYTFNYIPGVLTVTSATNANLTNLAVSTGTLTPTFATATTAYTVAVPYATTSITVTPTAADPAATIKVNGVAVVSGSASASIVLVTGANVITTVVTAQDGTTKVTYTTTVTRAAGNDASLSALALSSGSLSPTFVTGTIAYTALVANSVNSITVTPTAADAAAKISVNGIPVLSGAASVAIPLSVGINSAVIVVTSADGNTKLYYTVAVTRGVAADAIKPSNIISPDGDGKNDTWYIPDILLYPNNVVKVIDRNGKTVFEQKGYTNTWDATLRGSPLSEGTYFYVVDLGDGSKKITGYITVIRRR